jgi:GH15 family glucan-1,4-alpha-glucosidase
MARPIVLSNGELHVGINTSGLVHDFYYPYVGLENHAAGPGLHHRIGVWADGTLSWLDAHTADWDISFAYPYDALIGRTIAENHSLGIRIEFEDAVDADSNVFLRNIQVINLHKTERDIRIFMHQAFAIGDSRSHTDTAQYLPDSEAIVHYRGHRVFTIGGRTARASFDQHSIGLFGSEGLDGTYRDAEDGELSMSNVEHGRVDSTIRFKFTLQPLESTRLEYWISAGTSLREALQADKAIRKTSLSTKLHLIQAWWHKWLRPSQRAADRLDPHVRKTFIQSLLLIKSHIDNQGAVIASTDSTMLNYSRDAYAYCWPRDGAYVLWPLIRLGYKDEPRRFFQFCKKAMHPMGYLLHKYRADGALGSSWHPYINDGSVSTPIQEDETALVVFIFMQFYLANPSPELLEEFYTPMIKPMADFMTGFIDPHTNLPRPSYDLWEEQHLTTTYTTAVTYGALLAAAELAEVYNDADSAVRWRLVADDIYTASHKLLFNTDRQAFYKGIRSQQGIIEHDDTIDASSVFAAFMFGLYPADGKEIKAAISTLEERFSITKDTPGLGRYENDSYHRASEDSLGNPWINCTLWLAQYYTETDQAESAEKILIWVRERMLSTGVLPEQVSPGSYEPLSVTPLIWSQAEYVATLLDTLTTVKER